MTFKGKGSKQRPYNRDKFNENFDKIFKKSRTKVCEACKEEYRLDFYKTRQENYKVIHSGLCKNCDA
tara:strand:+ start:313 stop:513 length:201 start_codon:yes stop_codon:yes gene_type:complete